MMESPPEKKGGAIIRIKQYYSIALKKDYCCRMIIFKHIYRSGNVNNVLQTNKMSMLTSNLLCKLNSKTEWSAEMNEEDVEVKRVLCNDEVLDMVL